MEIPTFRYMQDAQRFLKEINEEVDESARLLKKQQQLLASALSNLKVVAGEVFDLTPSSRKDQQSTLRKMKYKMDPELEKVVVPNIKKLQSQYNLAEDFYEKLRGVEQAETQVQMTFHNRRGPEYDALMRQFAVLKEKIQSALHECLTFLAEVAQKHVPKKFKAYVEKVVDLVNEHVIFRDSQTFMYVSVDPEGNLVFTAYLMLLDVSNDEGSVAPHLYVSIQWVVTGDQQVVNVDLNHEYEVPNKLLGQGEPVGSVGEAVRAISTQLELENFAGTLGVVPLALQLNVDPTSIKLSMFKYSEVISEMKLDEHQRTLSFKLRKEVKNPEAITEIGASLYQQLKALMKKNGNRLSMKTDSSKKPAVITFTVTKVAEGGEVSEYDLEWLRDKFDLNRTQLRKIGNIINQPKQGPK